jgi:hypothetical protein
MRLPQLPQLVTTSNERWLPISIRWLCQQQADSRLLRSLELAVLSILMLLLGATLEVDITSNVIALNIDPLAVEVAVSATSELDVNFGFFSMKFLLWASPSPSCCSTIPKQPLTRSSSFVSETVATQNLIWPLALSALLYGVGHCQWNLYCRNLPQWMPRRHPDCRGRADWQQLFVLHACGRVCPGGRG